VIIMATELAGEAWILGSSLLPISLGWILSQLRGWQRRLFNRGWSPPACRWWRQQMDPGGRISSECWKAGSVQ